MKYALLCRSKDDGGFLHVREFEDDDHAIGTAHVLLRAGAHIACVEIFRLFGDQPPLEPSFTAIWRVARNVDDVTADFTKTDLSTRPT